MAPVPAGVTEVRLRGAAARTAANMTTSLSVPTATSVRAIPAKLLVDNRIVINNHLGRGRGGKVSFTHLIGYAIVKALASAPEMNDAYAEQDGKPALLQPEHVNLGLAIDVRKSDGSRQLLVPSIKAAEEMDFRQFWMAYEDVVRKARTGKLTVEDFAGTTISLTNPGTIGTEHSVPRLMAGQGCIVGVGAMEYPAAYQGASQETIARLAISKTVTLTSTYDHRIIQGAQSGDFLRIIHALLLGEHGFYDDVFQSLRIPYEPIRWVQDIPAGHEDDISKAARVHELIHAYRVRGHLMADTDPLEYKQRKHPDLDINQHGLTLWDLEREFATGGFGGKPRMQLREILGVLRDSYCRTVGVEYMHMQNPEERAWLQARIERPHGRAEHDEQVRILSRLNVAEAFEMFLQTKFVGQRRFSLEGAESLIPLLDAVLTEAAHEHLDEAMIGMAHRGRLNVLANIVGKSYAQIFQEFEGNLDPASTHGSGDVKYHLGASGCYVPGDGSQIPTSLVANPSHLEAVDPVLEGVVRAKQDVIDMGEPGFTVLPVLIHGDAAFAGQGVVAETLELSQLRGYRTGGTVHIVVNNQVGFTTAPEYSRSSVYSTDVARMIQAPIFHVNGDDPEAVVRVGRLAFEYRQTFRKDVVIDMICYRRRGHNEADNPSFTQPLMYDLIDAKRSVRKLYTEALIGRGDITLEEAEQALRDYQQELERAFTETRDAAGKPAEPGAVVPPEPSARQPANHDLTPTAITGETIKRIIDTQLNLPDGFTPHPRLQPQLQRRAVMVEQDEIDWATGELLAFGSVLIDGHAVRLVGQDTRRGTFGQRHAVLVDRHTGEEYTPLRTFNSKDARFHTYDSLLSEFAAVGFEYGYSVARPDALVCWEAQFGDFVNGAQTIIDEFISSGEQKWGQRSAVVLHAAARLRGPGPGPLVGPDRAVPRAVRPGQHDRGRAEHPGQLLPPAALAGPVGPGQAADRGHAQVHAAAEGGRLTEGGLHRRLLVPAGDRRAGRVRRRGRAAGADLHRQGLLRPGREAAGRRPHRHRAGPRRAALPAARRRTDRRGGQVPRRRRGDMGPGRTGQHGGLALHGAAAARDPEPAGAADVPAGVLGPGRRLGQGTRRGPRPAGRERPVPGAVRRVLHRPRAGGTPRPARGGSGHAGLAGRAPARVRRPEPGYRGSGGAPGHLAGAPG